jgi:hypothetical protein
MTDDKILSFPEAKDLDGDSLFLLTGPIQKGSTTTSLSREPQATFFSNNNKKHRRAYDDSKYWATVSWPLDMSHTIAVCSWPIGIANNDGKSIQFEEKEFPYLGTDYKKEKDSFINYVLCKTMEQWKKIIGDKLVPQFVEGETINLLKDTWLDGSVETIEGRSDLHPTFQIPNGNRVQVLTEAKKMTEIYTGTELSSDKNVIFPKWKVSFACVEQLITWVHCP